MITYKLHLIRTGRTFADSQKRYVGQTDLPLCGQGREALHLLREEYRYPLAEMVYTSPLRRCRETAGILYPDTYTELLEGLKDMNLGEFEGKSFDDLKGNAVFTSWLQDSRSNTPPGGEEAAAFTHRLILCIGGMFRTMMAKGIASAAVVTHGGVIMTLLANLGLPRAPLHQWAVAGGTGYTVLMTPEMWMRDGCFEVYRQIPELPTEDDMGMYGMDDFE